MVVVKSLAAVAALSLVRSVQAWYTDLPPCLSPFEPFVYTGCYDNGQPGTKEALSLRTDLDTQNMTVETCVATCKGNSFRLAGLSYYGVCYCGETVSTALLPEDQCSYPCTGNSSETCGGDTQINIWMDPTFPPYTDQANTTEYVSVGCWTDDSSQGKALFYRQDGVDSASMTTDTCLQACLASGFPFAGTEYGGECYCGVVIGNGTALAADASTCNMPCNGAPDEICGGPSRLSLYVAKDLQSLEPCGASPDTSSSSTTSSGYPTATPTTSTSTSTSSSGYPTTSDTTTSSSESSSSTTTTSESTTPSSYPTSTSETTTSTSDTTTSTSTSSSGYPTTTSDTTTSSSTISSSTTSSSATDSTTPSGYPTSTSETTTTSSSTTPSGYPTSSSTTSSSSPTTTSTTTTSSSTTPSGYPTSTPSTSSSSSTSSTTTSKTTPSGYPTSVPGTSSSSTTTPSGYPTSVPGTSSTTTTKKPPVTSFTTTITTTKSTKTTTTTTTTSATACTTTIVTPPTCEYHCGKWCSDPIPDWADHDGCLAAWSSCLIQTSSCFLQAGFPDSVKCFQFGEWCGSIKTYCGSKCPGGKCGKSDCYSTSPPHWSTPPVTHTSTTPCPTTTTTTTKTSTKTTGYPTTTTSSSSCPVPTPTGICIQPSNARYGYGPGRPVGGIELPVVACNNIRDEYEAGYPFKLYADKDSRRCPRYTRPDCGTACADACWSQYQQCDATYAEACRTYTGDERFAKSYPDAAAACDAQYWDCLDVNAGVTGKGRCSTWDDCCR